MPKGEDKYQALKHYAETRLRELSGMLEPYVAVTDAYGKLLCRISLPLGVTTPKDTQDTVVRDLMTDVFDFLYESRGLILEGKIQIAYVLVRRAYESLSLLALCAQDATYADKWESGKQIPNREVRKQLAKQSFSEPEANMRELYSFFSKATHPNRDLIPYRYLGQGNRFVFGSIGKPELVFVADFCRKHLQLWFWFGAVIAHTYRELLKKHDPECIQDYFAAADYAKEVAEWLTEQFNRLLKEAQKSMSTP